MPSIARLAGCCWGFRRSRPHRLVVLFVQSESEIEPLVVVVGGVAIELADVGAVRYSYELRYCRLCVRCYASSWLLSS